LFASLYEGFGLPVLEAMQLGTPVLTSNTSSLPEVAGDAALLVDPYDPSTIAEALRALDGDTALRDRLAQEGLQQAGRFTAPRYVERLTGMYNNVLTRPRGLPMAVFNRDQ
jgi:glycosyltransferase involved in cell wall biosynthesis